MVAAGARGSVRDHRVVLDRAVRWSLELCLLLGRHGTEIALVRSENSLVVRGRERALLGEAVVWLEVKLGQRDFLTETCLTSTSTGVVLRLKMVLPAAQFPLTQSVDEEEEESEGEDGGDRGGDESQTEVAHLAAFVLPPVAEPLTTTVAGPDGQTSLWRTAEDRAAEHR